MTRSTKSTKFPKMSESLIRCDYYNRTKCLTTGRGCGETKEVCKPPDGNEKTTLCYALWQNSTEFGFVPEFKGCWVGNHKDCNDRSKCIETRKETKKQLFFCCCDGDLCNTNITHIPSQLSHNITGTKESLNSPLNNHSLDYIPTFETTTFALILIVPIIALIVLLIFGYSFHEYRKKCRSNEVPTSEDPLIDSCPPSPYVGQRPIQLQEIKAQGKFGSVWKAKDGSDNLVAVKIFSLADRESWLIEQEVYRLPQMKHKNLLTYLGAESKGEGLSTEYWLITEYHSIGSLWDYLKAYTVDWNQLLTIAQGIARGLTHLHEELPASHSVGFKPTIAHRDFKSKNVLLTSNLTACIADFGLALVFYPNSTCGDAHGQVGTRRYMAPEVLEGAINFSRDSFLRIDMYACGLVLWELLSRCNTNDMTCGDYQLPFEEEIGLHPSLEDMQEIVAQQKKRPLMREPWSKHIGMNALCHTIEDCWDHDAEARLSASCVGERIDALMGHEFVVNLQNSINYKVSYIKPPLTNGGPLIMRETSREMLSSIKTIHL